MTTPNPTSQPLHSEFAGDPDMAELVDLFVQEMPQRIEQIHAAWHAQELGQVQRLAHQLKGASGGYGYPTLGEAAARLEKTLNQLSEGSQGASLLELRGKFDELIDLLRRVRV